jgi:hypothetical protein
MYSLIRGLSLLLAAFLLMQLTGLVSEPSTVLASHNHFKNDDSVTNGRIYYDDDMDTYHNALRYADDEWSALGSVNIRPTPSGSSPTLRAITYSLNDGLCGGWEPLSGPDRLQANRRNIDNNSCGSRAPRTLFLHEMGHALRIYDHDGTSYWYDVMYRYMIRHDQYGNTWQCPLNLQNHDEHDYRTWWG